MFIKILLVVAALVVAVLVAAAFQPSAYSVSRSELISASPEKLFAEVNDFHRWAAWSPYEKLDPAMKRTFEGPAAGVGAIYGWSGDRNVGSGKMTITESRPAERIGIKLEFVEPMAAVCDAVFTFQRAGAQTRVTWTMAGTNNYLAKIFCLFVNMDKMVGGQFAQGLADLKQLTESKR